MTENEARRIVNETNQGTQKLRVAARKTQKADRKNAWHESVLLLRRANELEALAREATQVAEKALEGDWLEFFDEAARAVHHAKVGVDAARQVAKAVEAKVRVGLPWGKAQIEAYMAERAAQKAENPRAWYEKRGQRQPLDGAHELGQARTMD